MLKYKKISDFHGERSKGVGSSDIATLAGLNRSYGSTSLTLWQQKTGRAEPWEGNARTAWGNKLEGLVLREFLEKRYGEDVAGDFYKSYLRDRSYKCFQVKTEARHHERKYCLAHADLLVDPINSPMDVYPEDLADPYIVEAKTTGMMAGKRREGQIFRGYDPDDLTAQGIPDSVFLQVQWQMYCYGVNTAYVAVLIDTADYREYGPIVADPRVQEKFLALAERFWQLVQADTPPAPETWDDVQALFPVQKDETSFISGDDEMRVREMIARDKQLLARENQLKEERKDIKNAIGVLLGGNSVLASAEGDVLAKSSLVEKEAYTVKASSYRQVRY